MDRFAIKLAALAQVAVHFGHARRASDIYARALDAVIDLVEADRASLLLFDGDAAGAPRFRATRGLSETYLRVAEANAPWARGQVEPQPIVLSHVAEVASSLGVLGAALANEGVGAVASYALVTASGTMGKLTAYWNEARECSEADRHFMHALAGLASFAIDRQRMVDLLEVERGLFVAGPSVVFKWRNSPTWPIEYVSPNVEPVFGYTQQALERGDPPYASLIHPDDVARVADEVDRYSRDERPWFEQEYRLRRGDGKWRWVYDFTVPIRDATGAVTHFHGYLLDHTERRANDDALNQRQRVESLGVMAGGVAHDFNNLLVGVMGNASLALRLLPRDGQAARYVTDVLVAAKSASELTRQLLAYSGGGHFVLSPVAVGEAVRDCVRLLGSVLASWARLDIDVPSHLTVKADPTQFRQVVMNLLTNASDALTEGRGGIRVTAIDAEVTADPPRLIPPGQTLAAGPYVILRVADTGAGMDPPTLASIFDPFFTTKGQGRGLGLSTVLGIVRSHRGAVDVESSPGVGSAINVYMPALVARSAQPEAKPPVVEATQRALRVLVVDDDDHVRVVLQHVLEMEGHVPTPVDSGERAITAFSSTPDAWDAVVMDLTMPRMNGIVALRHLRKQRPALPVVLISGFSKEGIPVEPDDRFTVVLEKPFTAEQLLDALGTVMRRSAG